MQFPIVDCRCKLKLFVAIDLNDFFDNSVARIYFTGLKADNSTVTADFTTDDLSGFETFNFANFTDLVSVSWMDLINIAQFDNINVTPTANATEVPEPFTVLGTIFGAGFGVALKRKLAKDRDKADIS
ncbi:PEP-CTERM sorting domain-containing protein [Chamaesiphon sp.]|uniref:PEP-CTERM sorting domain-containing protein n=1 Tax=Chamaesiphon sp. TaxID=2814140 RepID=UPI0035936776